MRADILIVGQGLAGTLLAWELERAGVDFAIVDPGHAAAASLAAAGIINPITGRRLVKSWRIETLLPAAAATYRALEAALGVQLWHPMRVRRRFADERERTVFQQKRATGELAPFASDGDDDGFWIEEAARVDLEALLRTARARWVAAGKLCTAMPPGEAGRRIDCTGAGVLADPDFKFVPWEWSKGELLEIAVTGLAPDVVLNRRHWVVPVGLGLGWVGSTHQPGVADRIPTAAARTQLSASAASLLGRDFQVVGHRAGLRVNLPDKHPVAGWHPDRPDRGLINGLGAKGALWAPWLARQWADHLIRGVAFDPASDVGRFRERARFG
jgi:glycine oxidase